MTSSSRQIRASSSELPTETRRKQVAHSNATNVDQHHQRRQMELTQLSSPVAAQATRRFSWPSVLSHLLHEREHESDYGRGRRSSDAFRLLQCGCNYDLSILRGANPNARFAAHHLPSRERNRMRIKLEPVRCN